MILGAEFSPCRIWRYSLTRQWNDRAMLVWMLLNPSTADESRDDPTIRRCIGFSMNHGYGGLMILNLFAYRATLPGSLMLPAVTDPVGRGNDAALRKQIAAGRTFACAWGNFPLANKDAAQKLGARVFTVCRILTDAGADVRALRLTGLGQPEHPLYLPARLRLWPWASEPTRFLPLLPYLSANFPIWVPSEGKAKA